MAHDQVALGATRDKILVCPRGVDLQRFYAPSPFPPVDSLRLVCTRSLFPEYCHNVILDAVAAVARRGVPISLDIAGDGVLLGDLKNQASALGIADRVRFHGKVPHDRLPEMLRACNVYVAMPTTEGVSASLFEAMACGCYPIVSDLTANRQWIATGSGALVAVDDTEGLERTLLAVWANPTVVAAAAVHNRALVSRARLAERERRLVYEELPSVGGKCRHADRMTSIDRAAAERERIFDRVRFGAAREIDGSRYARWQPAAALHLGTSRRIAARMLQNAGVFPHAGHACLEIGHGAVGWLGDLISWGVRETDISGIELDASRAQIARQLLPAADLRTGDASSLPWPDGTFHLVIASTVFSSILDSPLRQSIAAQIERVLGLMGRFFWYDLARNNPANPHVRKVAREKSRRLFPGLSGELRSTTLAAPVARAVAPLSWMLATVLEAIPPLRTHLLDVLV